MHMLLMTLLYFALFTAWYGLGRLCVSYAAGTRMDCYAEWDNTFAVLLWPLYLAAMIGEWIGDAGRFRQEAWQRRRDMEQADYARAMRELEKEQP